MFYHNTSYIVKLIILVYVIWYRLVVYLIY